MKLNLIRYYSSKRDTLGLLFIDGVFECYTLEDEHREFKVPGETRIPEGEYPIVLRTFGGFHKRYTTRFGDLHKGMLEIKDVPNFTDILIHTGHDETHTAGCLLVAKAVLVQHEFKSELSGSSLGYKALYKKVLPALESGEKVTIKITDNISKLFEEIPWENQGLLSS